MFEFFFCSIEAFNLALKILRETDTSILLHDSSERRVAVWDGDIKERIVCELALGGFGSNSYRVEYHTTEKEAG